MKLTIPRSELKAAIAGFNRIIPHKTTIPVLGHLRFEAVDNRVTASATDLDQQATYSFTGSACDGPGSFTASFHQLKDLAKGPDGDCLEFEATGSDSLAVVNPVAGQAVRLDVQAMDVTEWPTMAGEVKTAPVDDFLNTFQRLAPFASTDSTRYVLNSCFLDLTEKGPGKSKMVTTDGRRLTVCNSMTLPLRESAIIPTTKFLAWLRGNCQIGTALKGESQWFGLECGPWTYHAKTVSGTYPNYRQVLPVNPGDNKIVFPADISSVKAILKALPDACNKGGVVLRADSAGNLSVSAEGADKKKIVSIEVPGATYTGTSKQYALNREYLMEALTAGFRTFTFEDELSPAASDDGHGGKHVIMPMRLNSTAQAEPEAPEDNTAPVAATVTPPAETLKAVEPTAVTQVAAESANNNETKGRSMKHEDTAATPAATAVEKLQGAFEQAKDAIRMANAALAGLTGLIKDAVREDKLRRSEIDSVRATVAKIQSIRM